MMSIYYVAWQMLGKEMTEPLMIERTTTIMKDIYKKLSERSKKLIASAPLNQLIVFSD